MNVAADVMQPDQGRTGTADLVIRIDGRRPPSAETIADVLAVCCAAEDRVEYGRVVVHVTGAPQRPWARELTLPVVNRWERTLRRLERLPTATIGIAAGDCGGIALDALLATDYRIATTSVRLLLPVEAGATWPGLALYRLVRQAGVAAARRTVLLGAPIGARRALALNIIDELAEDTDAALAGVPGVSGQEIAIRRQLMLDAPATDFDDALGVHLAACDRLLRRVPAGET
jgi:isomerase DpgB